MVDRSLFLGPDQQTFDGKRAVPNEAVTKLMLDLADLHPGEKVLEIGTGSGYQTACLLETGATVYSVEREQMSAREDLFPATVEHGPAYCRDGKEPIRELMDRIDCIFVTCGMESIPPAYEEQLREGGRLIIPLGKPDDQELLRLEKRNGKLVLGRVGGYCRFQMAI